VCGGGGGDGEGGEEGERLIYSEYVNEHIGGGGAVGVHAGDQRGDNRVAWLPLHGT
jgi:hypothetical protein